MPTEATEIINIKPQSKHHGLFLAILGLALLTVTFLLISFYWQLYKLPLIFLVLVNIIVLFIGCLKFSEPSFSYQITRNYLRFVHRYGGWQLDWLDIIRFGALKTNIGIDQVALPYLGIKLKTLANIATSISPRLANKLLHEQQELLILAVKNQQIVIDSGLINFDPYSLNGHTYHGPVAAWLHRSEQLNNIYGYHLFLSESSFDRHIDEFLGLLKTCKYYANLSA